MYLIIGIFRLLDFNYICMNLFAKVDCFENYFNTKCVKQAQLGKK